MVEPVAFGFNEETAANNYFQQRTVAAGETVQACALKEFRGMVDKLRANGIEVIAVQDTQIPHTPDSIFPNNWVSFWYTVSCHWLLPPKMPSPAKPLEIRWLPRWVRISKW